MSLARKGKGRGHGPVPGSCQINCVLAGGRQRPDKSYALLCRQPHTASGTLSTVGR